jgi:transcriptional regulator with XRE-family HTH domain
MSQSTLLYSLRKGRSLSQAEAAKALGVSRPTYIALEQGKRKLTLSEAEKAARTFDISIDELALGKLLPVKALSERKPTQSKTATSRQRIGIPKENLQKFKEVLLYILEKVGGKENIGQTALYKLLYFIDFDYYEKYGDALVGAHYIKNHYGPTPVSFAKLVREMEDNDEIETVKSKYFQHEQTKYLPHRPPDLAILNAKEKTHIDDVLARLSDKNARELTEYSHRDVPWAVAKAGEAIKYEHVFYRTDEYSRGSYEEL